VAKRWEVKGKHGDHEYPLAVTDTEAEATRIMQHENNVGHYTDLSAREFTPDQEESNVSAEPVPAEPEDSPTGSPSTNPLGPKSKSGSRKDGN
jgi:hypothetical protein